MIQYLPDDRGILNAGDDVHGRTNAVGAGGAPTYTQHLFAVSGPFSHLFETSFPISPSTICRYCLDAEFNKLGW